MSYTIDNNNRDIIINVLPQRVSNMASVQTDFLLNALHTHRSPGAHSCNPVMSGAVHSVPIEVEALRLQRICDGSVSQ